MKNIGTTAGALLLCLLRAGLICLVWGGIATFAGITGLIGWWHRAWARG